MKLVDINGNEVEIADDNEAFKTAHDLKALGYNDIDALQSELDKARKQNEADNEMIKRQGNELGELRKVKQQPAKTTEVIEGNNTKQTETETEDEEEARHAKRNETLQATLTDDELVFAEKEFVNHYESATPEQRAALNTQRGRSAFLDIIFKGKSDESGSKISLFGKPKQPQKSIKDQVAELMGKASAGAPSTQRPRGTGYDPDKQYNNSEPVNTGDPSIIRAGLFVGK